MVSGNQLSFGDAALTSRTPFMGEFLCVRVWVIACAHWGPASMGYDVVQTRRNRKTPREMGRGHPSFIDRE